MSHMHMYNVKGSPETILHPLAGAGRDLEVRSSLHVEMVSTCMRDLCPSGGAPLGASSSRVFNAFPRGGPTS